MTMDWNKVLKHYDLPKGAKLSPIGGTASPKVRVETAGTRYILRRRPTDMVKTPWIEYDHALRSFLAQRDLPAPAPVPAADGRTWLQLDDGVYEMSAELPGKMQPSPDLKQLNAAGAILARFHQLGFEFDHAGKRDFIREDHVTILKPLLTELTALPAKPDQKQQLAALANALDDVALGLEGTDQGLEQSIIHGDFHPGNLLFEGKQVSAVLDYDYAVRGATLRDLGDALMFFATRHRHPFDPDDIRSLTQPWLIDTDRTVSFLSGYKSVRPIPPHWPILSSLMLSRWIQIRLRGSRKVPPDKKLAFVLDGFWEPVHLLKRHYQAWLKVVVEKL